ncbi:MAG: winged helix-turn-helix transcriptional regulator [Armatimonadetes bacterium]|nr:winged helix-turn-helix transcriptional regulator [Armatimonadota bacterium]
MKPRLTQEALVFRALAHPVRVAILETVRRRPVCVCHLAAVLDCPQAYISQQLATLRRAGLIEGHKDGAFVYYKARDYSILGMIDLVTRYLGRVPGDASTGADRVEGCACPECSGEATPAKGARG